MPKWVKNLGVIVVAGVLSVAGALYAIILEAQHSCERVVAARDDNRDVWEYVVGVSEEPESERVVAFVMFLDDRLPPLQCTGMFGRNPTPDNPTSEGE